MVYLGFGSYWLMVSLKINHFTLLDLVSFFKQACVLAFQLVEGAINPQPLMDFLPFSLRFRIKILGRRIFWQNLDFL